MRRISRVVEAPLDDMIALFDEFHSTEALQSDASVRPSAETPAEPMPEQKAEPMSEATSEQKAEPISKSTVEMAPQESTPVEEQLVLPLEAPSGASEERPAAAEETVETPVKAKTANASGGRSAAVRAARRRLRKNAAAKAHTPPVEEIPIFTETVWMAEAEGHDEPASFMARAEAALGLPEEPLLARIAFEQNRAVFLTDEELRAEEARLREETPPEAEAAPQTEAEPETEAVSEAEPVEPSTVEESEPPVREMPEEELEAESHISTTGATVNVYRMYDVAAATEASPKAREPEPTIEAAFYETASTTEIEAEAFDAEPVVEVEPETREAEPTDEIEAAGHDVESSLEIVEPEIEVEEVSSPLPARARLWPWETSEGISLEEALEALSDKELSGLTTEIVTNTVEGALEEGAVKSLCRRYSLRLEAVYSAILRESKRRISRMTEKHPVSSGGTDATRELGMRMAKKLLAADMHHKRTWFQSPFPEADGRYYIIQSHRVEDEKLPTEFPTERVHYEELGDGWAISVGY